MEAAGQQGFGDKLLHIGAASVEPGTGAVRGFFAGQDFLQSQLNWAVQGGQAGSTFKPFALPTALRQGYSLKSTFEGNSPLTSGAPTSRTRATRTTGAGISLLQATEDSINTAYIDMATALDDSPSR